MLMDSRYREDLWVEYVGTAFTKPLSLPTGPPSFRSQRLMRRTAADANASPRHPHPAILSGTAPGRAKSKGMDGCAGPLTGRGQRLPRSRTSVRSPGRPHPAILSGTAPGWSKSRGVDGWIAPGLTKSRGVGGSFCALSRMGRRRCVSGPFSTSLLRRMGYARSSWAGSTRLMM